MWGDSGIVMIVEGTGERQCLLFDRRDRRSDLQMRETPCRLFRAFGQPFEFQASREAGGQLSLLEPVVRAILEAVSRTCVRATWAVQEGCDLDQDPSGLPGARPLWGVSRQHWPTCGESDCSPGEQRGRRTVRQYRKAVLEPVVRATVVQASREAGGQSAVQERQFLEPVVRATVVTVSRQHLANLW